jgi:hypothetical protein
MLRPVKPGVLSVLLVLVSCGPSADPGSRREPADSRAEETPVDVDEARAVAYELDPSLARGGPPSDHFSDELPLAWRGDGIEQRWTATDFRTLVVTDLTPGGTITHERTAAFTFLHVEPARLDAYDLLGVTADEDLVVVRWTLVPREAGDDAGDEGAAPASRRPPPKDFEERRLFQGLRGHRPLGIQGDPQGRFVLFAARDEASVVTVYRIDATTDGNEPVPLTTSLAIPELSDLRTAQKFDHAQLGRVYVLGTSFEDRHRVVFVDADDDGVFERPPLVGDDAFFEQQGLDRYEDWRSLIR